MHSVESSVLIAVPPEEVFEYVTTPATWPKWFPLTVSVSGPVDSTPPVGTSWKEVGKLGQKATWTTVELESPHLFVYDGISNGNSKAKARITYTFVEEKGGTFWKRHLEYATPGLIGTFLNLIFLRYWVRRASAKAVINVKAILESQANRKDKG